MEENKVHNFFNETQNYLHRDFGVRIRAEIIADLIQPKSSYILDTGCGDGGVSIQFLADNRVVFLDLSDNMLELVRKKIQPQLLSKATILNTAFSDFHSVEKFDVILAIGLLAHLPSLDDFFFRMKEIIKVNGVLILQFSDSGSWITRLNFLLAKRYEYKLNKLSSEKLLQHLLKNGFSLKQEVKYGLQLPGMGILSNRLLYTYARFILKSGIGRLFGTERIWKLSYDQA
jgi:cyclopropane fatty-acyl-phospholipid synthase-like methyltransferase